MMDQPDRPDRNEFLQAFLGKKHVHPDRLSKYTLHADKWDLADVKRLIEEFQEFAVSQDDLVKVTETGDYFFHDAWFSLFKANPELKNRKEVRPTYQINHMVSEEAMGLTEYMELRDMCVGDEIGAALACVSMEPTYEELFDKKNEQMKAAQEAAQQLEGIMCQLAGMAGEAEDI